MVLTPRHNDPETGTWTGAHRSVSYYQRFLNEAWTLKKTDPLVLKINDPPNAQLCENEITGERQERLALGWDPQV